MQSSQAAVLTATWEADVGQGLLARSPWKVRLGSSETHMILEAGKYDLSIS